MNNISKIRSELRYVVRELGLLQRNCWESGLSLIQAHVLTYLAQNGDTPSADLCRHLNMEKASLSRSLGTLESKGYICLNRDPADKRKKSIVLSPSGLAALARANSMADTRMAAILNGLEDQEVETIQNGLRLLRICSFRHNLDRTRDRIQLERLNPAYEQSVNDLLNEVFYREQGIPQELIPIPTDYPSQHWCARAGEYIVGTVACWQENNQWHWGRFAVERSFRGSGIGKQLARHSLEDLFANLTDCIISDARDATVHILKDLGARAISPAQDFYGMPVTAVSLEKADFHPDS